MASRSLTETAALVAQLDGDVDKRDDLLADFFPSELETFIDQLDRLRDAALAILGGKSAR